MKDDTIGFPFFRLEPNGWQSLCSSGELLGTCKSFSFGFAWVAATLYPVVLCNTAPLFTPPRAQLVLLNTLLPFFRSGAVRSEVFSFQSLCPISGILSSPSQYYQGSKISKRPFPFAFVTGPSRRVAEMDHSVSICPPTPRISLLSMPPGFSRVATLRVPSGLAVTLPDHLGKQVTVF